MEFITLGIGTPSSIAHFVLFGLSPESVVVDGFVSTLDVVASYQPSLSVTGSYVSRVSVTASYRPRLDIVAELE